MSFIYSVSNSFDKHHLVKIEAKLNKGIPRVSVIGMPESVSKRVLLKAKSAIVNQGFKWSLPKHLVISLDPPVDSKSTELLDLGFAVSILQELGQLKLSSDKKLVAVGALDLEGGLQKLDVEARGLLPKSGELWLGSFKRKDQGDEFLNIEKLSYLNNLKSKPQRKLKAKTTYRDYTRRVESLSPVWVKTFEVLVHGEHSSMLLMPDSPEITDFLTVLRDSLNSLDFRLIDGVRFVDGERPFVQINSAVTRSQILGRSGKSFYHYAHGGMAYLDHFCGLGKQVRDAIRSKVQGGGMAIGERVNVMLVARNPLCPCGKAKLGKPIKCGFSLYKCRSVLEKLSVDEFSMFQVVAAPVASFFELYPHSEVDMDVLNKRKRLAYETQKKRKQQVPNSHIDLFLLKEMMSKEAKALSYIPVVNGLDRTQAILSVARTLADLEGSEKIEKEHIEKAVVLAYKAAKEISKAF